MTADDNITIRQCSCLDGIVGIYNLFTMMECKSIIKNALTNWTEKEARINIDAEIKDKNLDYRNTTLYIPPFPDEWLCNTILTTIKNFNDGENGYGFEIEGLAEPTNVLRYQAPDIDKNGKPGKYDWHIDLGHSAPSCMRKLSFSILLNPNEYEGGEFVTKRGEETIHYASGKAKDLTGLMILFPSYILHKVSEVTKGTRYACVGWVHGPSFK